MEENMADVLFVLKTLIVTFILLVLMQIKVSGVAVETHMHRWIKKSAVVDTLKGVAHGAVTVIDKGYDSAMEIVESKPAKKYGSEQKAGAGSLELSFDRSNFKWDRNESENENEKVESPGEDDSTL